MKFIKNLSIKNKLILMVLFVSILAITIGFTVITIQDISIFKKDLVDMTKMNASTAGDACSSMLVFGAGYEKEVNQELKRLRTIPYIENAYVFDDKGDIFGRYNRSGEDVEPILLGQDRFVQSFGNYLHVYQPIYVDQKKIGAIYLRSSTYLLNKKIRNYLFTIGLEMIGLIILSYLLALKLQRVISGPILKLASVMDEVSKQTDYAVRVHKQGDDEIGRLYDGFNNMLEQIQLRETERDVAQTARERLFLELQEKNKELEQVVYVTSHDLRSPLVNIQGFSKELEYSLKDLLDHFDSIPPQTREKIQPIIEDDIPDSLRYIMTSAFKMDSLLSGLLKLSRVGRSEVIMSKIDMNSLIHEVQQAFEFQIKEAGVEIEIGDLPPCFGDEPQINQVFSNLLNNALKYLDPQRPGLITISGEIRNHEIFYCIADNGIGIAEEHRQKVFEIFHRLNPIDTGGEGLGLTIVQKIINRHRGKVWVESKLGEGSRFFIVLPANA